MADPSSTTNVLSGFAFHLAENQLLDKQIALSALQFTATNKISYIDHLVKQKLLSEVDVAHAVAEYFWFAPLRYHCI